MVPKYGLETSLSVVEVGKSDHNKRAYRLPFGQRDATSKEIYSIQRGIAVNASFDLAAVGLRDLVATLA